MALLVATIVMSFLAILIRLIPGSPMEEVISSGGLSQAQVAELRHEMGVDAPFYEQVYRFGVGVLHGTLGSDVISHQSVLGQIASALPHTIILAVLSLLIALLLGTALAVISAARPNGLVDSAIGAISIAIVTIPSYVAGLLYLLIFVVWLNWFPAIGTSELSHPSSYIQHLVLPVMALATSWTGLLARLIRASLLEVLSQNYIRAARAQGMHGRLIYLKYSLRNALVPTVAVLGVGLGNLLGGAILVETIFQRYGIGTVILRAVQERNFPVLRGCVFVIALLFILANLLADLAYHYLNPRLRTATTRSGS